MNVRKKVISFKNLGIEDRFYFKGKLVMEDGLELTFYYGGDWIKKPQLLRKTHFDWSGSELFVVYDPNRPDQEVYLHGSREAIEKFNTAMH